MGKITIDELSNELKEYMNGLGLTEEQVQALIDAGLVDINNNLGSLTTKVNNSQNYKLTNDNGYSKVITSGSVNDIKTAGWYVLGDQVSDCPLRDQGYQGWFHLEVIGSDSNWLKQTITVLEATGYGTRMWIRGMQNGTWAPWREFIDSSVVTKLNNSQLVKMTEDSGVCRGIPNNNANDITTTGVWMGQNVTNGPSGVTSAWIYLESFVHNELYQMQRVTDLHDCSKIWTRHKTSGNWSAWRRL